MSKPYLLHLETATTNCSVAVSKGEELLYCKESNSPDFRHSDYLHLFIEEALSNANVKINKLNGVGVSMGPGSYTGLRIGVSSAKGICYANDIPLMAVNTLAVMAQQCKIEEQATLLPMIDARRMEVFTMPFNQKQQPIAQTKALIISEETIAQLPKGKKIVFGSGAEKCKSFFTDEEFHFRDDIRVPSAKDMLPLILEKFNQEQFEDVAYFEPFYLKDFYTNPPKPKSV